MPMKTDVLDLDSRAADPPPDDGNIWYNATAGTHRVRQGGVTYDIPGAGGGVSLPGITKTIFVDKGSNAVTNGTVQNPYHDLAAAIGAAVLLVPGPLNQIAIAVYPGDYSEPALALPSWVTVVGVSEDRVVVRATDNGNPLFDMGALSALRQVSLAGPNASACVRANGVPNVEVEDVHFLSGAIGVYATGANAAVRLDECDFASAVGRGIWPDNGSRIDGDAIYTEADTGVLATGSSQAWISNARCYQSPNSIYSDDGSTIYLNSVVIDGADVAIRTDTATADVYGSNVDIRNSTTYDVEQRVAGSKIELTDCRIPDAKVSWADLADLALTFASPVEGEPVGFNAQHTSVGSPGLGRKTALGEGISYVQDMVVVTTDNTAGPVSDGGNFTDVSAAARSPSGSTFSFQGVGANHTVLIGSAYPNRDNTDVLKHFALRVLQTTAAVEVSPRSFVMERWDGAAWTAFGTMAVSDPELYRYANELFIRANSREFIRYGIDQTTTWAKKLINGQNLYWVRIRIAAAVTTAPVFEQFRLVPDIFLAEEDGSVSLFGAARFRSTLVSAGNVFGETGGIVNANIAVGAGGIPTGWTHNMINNLFNSDGDAIYYQLELPRNLDTSQPLDFDVALIQDSGGSPSLTDWIMSVLPVEVEGVLEADPTGGKVPVPRTLANTETVTAKAAQTANQSVNMVLDSKARKVSFTGFDVSNYYGGDLILIRLELDNDGPNAANVALLFLAIEGVRWALGERL